MTNQIATRDEMKAVERWENEGGRVSPLNNLRASLKINSPETVLQAQTKGGCEQFENAGGNFQQALCGSAAIH